MTTTTRKTLLNPFLMLCTVHAGEFGIVHRARLAPKHGQEGSVKEVAVKTLKGQ